VDSAGVAVKAALLNIAAIREDVVELEDQKLYVREIGTLEFAEYGRLLKANRVKATAMLIAACVIDGPGGNPVFTNAEEAEPIAKSARASMPILNKVMRLSGFKSDDKDDDEKEPDAS
jgi:hypothetical protein